MKIEKRGVAELAQDPKNARSHDDKNIEAIKRSLQEFGQQKPIVVSTKGKVVAGNGTLAAAVDLGWNNIAVVETDLVGSSAAAYAIADNRTAELAVWDDGALSETLETLCNDESFDELVTGFTKKEIDEIIRKTSSDVEQDDVQELQEEAITKVGDLWLLGEHRLLCGDATNEDDVSRLMDGERIDLCFTSPPYNLGKNAAMRGMFGDKGMCGKTGNAYTKYDDSGTDQKWLKLVEDLMDTSRQFCDVVVFNVQPLAGNKRVIWKWIADLSECLVDVLIWNKGAAIPGLAKGVCAASYEMFVIAGKKGSTRSIPFASWQGTLKSVYEAPPQRQNEFASIHGATFPIHLPAFIIGELCDLAATAYDCCMGTGTTLIACEQLNRKCYGMEIDPLYCDATVKRWENLTGEKAVLDG